MSLQLNVDIKALYRKLCPKCAEILVDTIRVAPDRETIIRILEGQAQGKVKKRPKR